ncbi:MAG: type II/IV secretion system protein [Syntrophaceae bacterium]|jgi:type II secretory ATPase GspE/PulE/Tfp pilus assembly ATPase PilB-like protein|nr:type II/IV secretion system protein [Syntrophaceae bacterium]
MNHKNGANSEEDAEYKKAPQKRALPGKSALCTTVNSVLFSREYAIPDHLLKNLRYEYLRRELWVPLEIQAGKIVIIVDDPNNILKRDMIENILKTKFVEYRSATKQDILKFIEYFYDIAQPEDESTLSAIINGDSKKESAAGISETDVNIVKIINEAINEAFDKRASDIHIEPDTKDKLVKVRFRIDGECISYKNFPFEYRSAIVSRIKIMADLDITEKRLPQDGKIKYKVPGADEIELRVATLPTHGYVEDVVLRLLTRGAIMTLEELEMPQSVYTSFKAQLAKPYGLILLVGPTGSGKTTTAHAALHIVNRPNVKIWTAEDPVEITQQGIRQLQIHHKIGLDFAAAMRSFLRADPDIIMVGEMRDYETAKMGIEASTTGHLVMSTLHTNNAPETIVRLLDMGIDPFAFADSLLCVLAQRLVRRLCPKCREAYHPPEMEFAELAHHYGEKAFTALNISYGNDFTLHRAKGCAACNFMGYRGRMGLFELLLASDNIKQMIISRKSIAALRKTAMNEGMETLLQCGVRKVMAGETDLLEVLSVCIR